MPNCCVPTRVQFINATSTTITYDEVMRDKYGAKPRVFVYYHDDVTGELYQSTFFTLITFNGSAITVDHGGPNSGFVVVT